MVEDRKNIRNHLIERLKQENSFWSFDMSEGIIITDELLILKTLIHLDIDDINLLFFLFSKKKIKRVWREQLVPQGNYYFSLNKMLAWLYFDVKKPEQYIKMITTKYINHICMD